MNAQQLFQARQDRTAHPAGTFDKKGRFYLSERASCCNAIRTPSARWPYSEMLHGRTLRHIKTAIKEEVIKGVTEA